MNWCIDCQKYGSCQNAQYADSPACKEFQEIELIYPNNLKQKKNGKNGNNQNSK